MGAPAPLEWRDLAQNGVLASAVRGDRYIQPVLIPAPDLGSVDKAFVVLEAAAPGKDEGCHGVPALHRFPHVTIGLEIHDAPNGQSRAIVFASAPAPGLAK